MKWIFTVLALAAITVGARAEETPPEVGRLVAGAGLRGAAEVRFLTFPLYEAQLWTPGRASVDSAERFALSLIYKRGFRAASLADASVSEIARMEGRPISDFTGLEELLLGCFADVEPQDRITGVAVSADDVAFFVNGEQSCRVTYPDLRDRFFGIWLGENTRDPKITARLRGQG